MLALTEADKITGGVLSLAADHLVAGRKLAAAAALIELAHSLNTAATEATMADEDDWVVEGPALPAADPQRLAACARGVHDYPDLADARGWKTCRSCGNVWVAAS